MSRQHPRTDAEILRDWLNDGRRKSIWPATIAAAARALHWNPRRVLDAVDAAGLVLAPVHVL